MGSEAFLHLWQRRHQVLFPARVSYVYHRRRQRFFALADQCTKAATVLLGGSMLSDFARAHSPLVGGLISGLGLLALVADYGDRKQCHRELAEAFAQLVGAIEKVGETGFTLAQVNDWHGQLQALNAKEPPALHTLTTICQNEVAIASGNRDSAVPVPWYKRQLASFVSFG